MANDSPRCRYFIFIVVVVVCVCLLLLLLLHACVFWCVVVVVCGCFWCVGVYCWVLVCVWWEFLVS